MSCFRAINHMLKRKDNFVTKPSIQLLVWLVAMDASYRKEKSTRQHMKIDLHTNSPGSEDVLLLANPMACDGVSPGGSVQNQLTSKHDVHTSLLNSTSPPAVVSPTHSKEVPSEQQTSANVQTVSHSRTHSLEFPQTSLSSSISKERSSFKEKGKSRPKSPSLFRFFVKGHGVGGNSSNGNLTNSPMTGRDRRLVKRASMDDEEDYGGDASSNSDHDHEDPFSPRGLPATGGDLITNRHAMESPKSSRSIEHNAILTQNIKRHTRNSSGGSGNCTQRDSGFSSERESISHLREDKDIFEDARSSVSPLEENFTPAGMNALESLHNQLQILLKQNSNDERTESVTVYEQTIASLSQQIEDMSLNVDCLRQTDQNLRMSLRLAEQRTLEAETKLVHTQDRCQRVESRYLKLSSKHQLLARKYRDMEKFQHKQSVLLTMERAGGTVIKRSSPPSVKSRTLPQRVHSQTQYDRRRPDSAPSGIRPSTAQGFNQDHTPLSRINSLSHTETCV